MYQTLSCCIPFNSSLDESSFLWIKAKEEAIDCPFDLIRSFLLRRIQQERKDIKQEVHQRWQALQIKIELGLGKLFHI